MTEAFERYSNIISLISSNGRRNRKSYQQSKRRKFRNNPYFSGNLDELAVTLTGECESVPYQEMDESCKKLVICSTKNIFKHLHEFPDTLTITNDSSGHLDSKSIWGILRGLESFSQIIVYAGDGTAVNFYHLRILDLISISLLFPASYQPYIDK